MFQHNIRIPADFFVEIDKVFLKFIGNCMGSSTAKTILKKSNRTYPFQYSYFRTTVIKSV